MNNENSHIREGIESCLMLLTKALAIVIAIIAVSLVCCSCTTTKYVEVPGPSHSDTVRITQQQRDSIRIHDSIYVQETQRGDTVYIKTVQWRTSYQERYHWDTTYVVRIDSIPFRVEVPVEKIVEKELSWWQKFRLALGNAALVAILALCGYGVFKLWRYFRP